MKHRRLRRVAMTPVLVTEFMGIFLLVYASTGYVLHHAFPRADAVQVASSCK